MNRMDTQQQQDTILVTGSNGLIGYAVAKRLAGDYPVVGFQHHEKPDAPPGVDRVMVDLTSDESVRRGLDTVRERYGSHLASVVHLAAYYDFSGEPSYLYEDLTVRGTERLLRGLQSFQVEQFSFSSSMLVYAPSTPEHPIDEDWPVEPKWAYPKSKVRTEDVIRAERGNIP
ncbi:MAG TPA: NAD-dependent epimerase/dehydratase family protein, partial [Ktedonobacterales bacterium]|nr:NAD-dependent epimerase/dehydratase family protein [Ktedonobacterales bacterium]